MRRSRPEVALFLSWVVGCARGEDGRVGGSDAAMDGAVDAAMDADVDASAPDAGLSDTGPLPGDAGPGDAGPPLACTAANVAAVCGGRPCVDNYCCNEVCDGTCRSCAVSGREGICTSHQAASDPEDECAEQAATTCGTTGTCDGSGGCAYHPSSITCDDGADCTSEDACDGAGMCRGAAPSVCAPGAGNECCIGSCGASGCTTTAGSCADICGGSQLAIGRTCQGCGAAGAAGSCLGGVIHQCDAASHSACAQVSCGGMTYVCTNSGGSWAWRTALACDDSDPCTYGDVCGGGMCRGTALSCMSTTCLTRSCNGTSTCTETANAGTSCDDGDACTYGETCTSAGVCGSGSAVSCTSTTCLMRSCNGTSSCTETPRTSMVCDDTNACTHGETCNASGMCGGGSAVTCPADTTCRTYACNGTSTCAPMARNVGGACDDGNAGTPIDRCQADGTCLGMTCQPALTSVFADAFGTPSTTTWTSGTDAPISGAPWHAFTSAQHGVRVNGGRLEITNRRGSSGPDHGQGYATVRTGGAGSSYAAMYNPTLKSNSGSEIVWSLNMRRDDPDGTNGGFSCSSTSSQNGVTVGLAYVLASDSSTGLNAATNTCNASATARGYAVVMGGSSRRVRLVRFENGLRNGTLTNLVESGSFGASSYFSVRVTYNTVTDQWRLEARSDGTSAFADPAAGSYGFTGTATDATFATIPLEHAGPYLQTGCAGLCNVTYTARFDNVQVGLRCAP